MNLSEIHPELRRRVEKIIALAARDGHNLRVVSAFRSHTEQNALYAKGRTAPGKRVTNARGGQSWHNFGLAVDLAPVIDGKISWSESFDWSLIGKYAKQAGLEWGGNWTSFKDRPHVQLTTNLSLKQLQQLYQFGGLSYVWATISKRLSPVIPAQGDQVDESPIEDLKKVEAIVAEPPINKAGANITEFSGEKKPVPSYPNDDANKAQAAPASPQELPAPSFSNQIENVFQTAQKTASSIQEKTAIAGQVKDSVSGLGGIVGMQAWQDPIKVTSGKSRSFWTVIFGMIFSAFWAVVGFVKENWQIIALCVLAVVVLIAVQVVTFTIINAIKMKYAADPTKNNVE